MQKNPKESNFQEKNAGPGGRRALFREAAGDYIASLFAKKRGKIQLTGRRISVKIKL